jgi:hypothetical protein
MSEVKIQDLKNALIKHLYSDDDVVKLIDPTEEIASNDDLLGTHIFPFFKVNYTLKETGTYICVKIDELNNIQNEAFSPYRFSVMVVSHNEHLLYKGCSRVDVLGEKIKELLAWNDDFGFQLKLKNSTEGFLGEKYYYRTLDFISQTYNNLQNKFSRNMK